MGIDVRVNSSGFGSLACVFLSLLSTLERHLYPSTDATQNGVAALASLHHAVLVVFSSPFSSSQATICATDSSTVCSAVLMVISGASGAS